MEQYTDVQAWMDYATKVRARTHRVIEYVPEDKIEWTYQEGKFTIGDIIRHIAAIERFMYAENALFKPGRYSGCGIELAEGYANVVRFLKDTREESMEIFAGLSNEDLQKKCTTAAGTPITLWKWLRLMIEHEIHHRGQIYMYLGMLNVPTPPLYGLTSEEVVARSGVE